MKQHITQTQMGELTTQEKIKLADWADPIDTLGWERASDGHILKYRLPLLTIGEMIWFLNDHVNTIDGWWCLNKSRYPNVWTLESKYEVGFGEEDREELCDCLWEAVKSVLRWEPEE